MQSTFNSAILSGLTLGAFATCSITAQSLAGPVWDVDYNQDAGQLAGTAQIITSSLSPIINIYGRLSTGFVNNDLVDMYQIAITSQTLVSISTAGGTGGGSATFDSRVAVYTGSTCPTSTTVPAGCRRSAALLTGSCEKPPAIV